MSATILPRREVRARRSQSFHAQRLAAARTPQGRVQVAQERIRALLARSDDVSAARIATQVTDALTRIADVAEEQAVRGHRGAA
jgi:D-mannonate dehydratase